MRNFAKNLLKLTSVLAVVIGLVLVFGGESQAQPPAGSVVVIGVVPDGPAAVAGLSAWYPTARQPWPVCKMATFYAKLTTSLSTIHANYSSIFSPCNREIPCPANWPI